MQRYTGTAMFTVPSVAVIPNATVTVYIADTTNKAVLFSDIAGIVPKGNPFSADAYGQFDFCAANGRYDVVVALGTQSNTIYDVILNDLSGIIPLVADVRSYGFSLTASAAVNAKALQDAINSTAAVLCMPSGTYNYDTGLTINRAIQFEGSGSCEDNGAAGVASTVLNYTGAGVGITLVGSGANGKENIHLSNFMLTGTNAATEGIIVGSDVYVTKSSLKNIKVSGFTKVGARGIWVKNCLETIFENVYAQGDYEGIVLDGNITTLQFSTCYARSNTHRGWSILNAGGASFSSCLSESNAYEGLYIYSGNVSQLSFYDWHSEANNTSGLGHFNTITGSVGDGSPSYIRFFGGDFAETLPIFSLDYATNISWYDLHIAGYSTGFITVTGNTLYCQFYSTIMEKFSTDITGNTSYGVMFNSGGNVPSRHQTVTVTYQAEVILPYLSGIIMIIDTTNDTSAIFSLNGAAHNTTLLSANSTSYSNTLGTSAHVNVAWDTNAYKIQNNLGIGISSVFIIDALLANQN